MPIHLKNSGQLREYRANLGVKRLGFVPTMGNLHVGHLALVEEVAKYCDEVLVSIFINPTQFSPEEDYDTYPRTLEKDIKLLSTTSCNAVFTPSTDEVYCENTTKVANPLVQYPDIEAYAKILCGVTRPHFFYGIVNVVCRLFTMVQPNVACFGEKDYQQLRIISAISHKRFPSIQILPLKTQRNAQQLALSSRNNYFSNTQLETAALLSKHMQATVHQLNSHTSISDIKRHWSAILQEATDQLQHYFEIDYFEVRHSHDLQLIASAKECHPDETTDVPNARLFAAVYLSGVRLIDNWALWQDA